MYTNPVICFLKELESPVGLSRRPGKVFSAPNFELVWQFRFKCLTSSGLRDIFPFCELVFTVFFFIVPYLRYPFCTHSAGGSIVGRLEALHGLRILCWSLKRWNDRWLGTVVDRKFNKASSARSFARKRVSFWLFSGMHCRASVTEKKEICMCTGLISSSSFRCSDFAIDLSFSSPWFARL